MHMYVELVDGLLVQKAEKIVVLTYFFFSFKPEAGH
jgi:hypothetical protein